MGNCVSGKQKSRLLQYTDKPSPNKDSVVCSIQNLEKYLHPQDQLFTFRDNVSEINRYMFLYYYYALQLHPNNDKLFRQGVLHFKGKHSESQIEKQIQKFENNSELLMKGVLEDNQQINKLLEVVSQCSNPSVYPYLNYLLYHLHQKIHRNFSSHLKQTLKVQSVFVVVKLNEKDRNKLVKIQSMRPSDGEAFMFNSFVKGFVKSEDAIVQKKKNQDNFLFTIQIPVSFQHHYRSQLDSGFYINKNQKVLFDFFNVFKLDKINIEEREIDASFGRLSELEYHRSKSFRYQKDCSIQQKRIFKIWDFLRIQKLNIKTQADLFYAFYMRQQYQQSLGQEIRTTLKSKSQKDNSTIDQTNITQFLKTDIASTKLISNPDSKLQKMGDLFAIQNNKVEALENYNSMSDAFRGKLKILLAHFFIWKSSDTQEFKKIYEEANDINTDRKVFTYLAFKLLRIAVNIQTISSEKSSDRIEKSITQIRKDMTQLFLEYYNGRGLKKESIHSFPFQCMIDEVELLYFKKITGLGLATYKEGQMKEIECSIKSSNQIFKGINYIWVPLGK